MIKILDKMGLYLMEFNNMLSNSILIPSVMQTMGLALLTILIPLTIAILSNPLQKKKDKDVDFITLDLHVILDEVFQFKYILISIGLIYLPLFFWKTLPLLLLILWCWGIYNLVRIIFNVYKWTKGNVFGFRFLYLSNKVRNQKDLEFVWRSVWQSENINIQNEREFFKIFSSKVDKLFQDNKENLIVVSKLLNDFESFLKNRSIFFLVISHDIFSKILDWHFKIWREKKGLLKDKRKRKDRTSCFQISRILNSVIKEIEKRALKENELFAFLNDLKKHSEEHKNDLEYLGHLFNIFYRVFFDNIECSLETDNILEDYFPKEWKVTKSKLENEENLISRISLKEFLKWAQDRIQQDKERFDGRLNYVGKNLFPEVEPIIWSRILLFVYSDTDNRIKSIIERKWNFGLSGRGFSGVGVGREEFERKFNEYIESQTKNAFELALFLFSEQFTKENLEKYIEELKKLKLKYDEDTKEEKHRLRLLNIFEEMLVLLKSNKT